jgi:uncharacterized protein
MVSLGEDQRLDPRVIPLQRTVGAIVAAVVTIGSIPGVISAWAGDGGTPGALAAWGLVWAVANAAFAWHLQRWPAIEYRHASYRVDEHGIEIRRGVYWRTVTTVPRSRIQHTDVSQGPLERRYGLGTLVIYTAGTDHAKVTLGGLAYDVAFAIREHLMPERGTDAV